jgi:signal transduction histidine kinase
MGATSLVLDFRTVMPPTTLCIVLLPYSLARWGSGREIAIGSVFVVLAYVVAALRSEMRGAEEAIGGALVLLFPGAVGVSVRLRADAHRHDLEHARLRERTQIARDLHDTVAHHISAIAIQAQAGRAVLGGGAETAARIFEAIESESKRTLSELRVMVGSLREGADAPLTPQPVVRDIERLARPLGDAPAIEVQLGEGLDRLPTAMQSALYRIAQESITNAIRHARGAKVVRVRIVTEGDAVRLTVDDDGMAPGARERSGFGLVGARERAEVFGGSLHAGPRAGGGWRVEVMLPRAVPQGVTIEQEDR